MDNIDFLAIKTVELANNVSHVTNVPGFCSEEGAIRGMPTVIIKSIAIECARTAGLGWK